MNAHAIFLMRDYQYRSANFTNIPVWDEYSIVRYKYIPARDSFITSSRNELVTLQTIMVREHKSRVPLELSHSQFFALRTPLLPFSELSAWSEALTANQTWAADADPASVEKAWMEDVQLLRGRLRSVIARPEILHALYVASPSLLTGIEHWRRDPDSKKGLQAERALVRYFARMAARPTPFGLFSGCSTGRIDEAGGTTVLHMRPRPQYRLCCRLDFDYLFALTAALQRDPALQMELRYWPNSSLHRIANAWHYTESRLEEAQRTHHLVKIESDPYLEAVLERARTGATVSELVAAVLGAGGDLDPSEEEAQEFVLGLIRENEILTSNLSPLLTGATPLDDAIRQLDTLPSGAVTAGTLRGIREQIQSLEQAGLNCVPEDYQAITAEIEKLPAKFDLAKLYQVDMIKPVEEAVLGKAVMDELMRGVEILCRLGETIEPDELKSFRKAFSERFGLALVPLMEALDEEAGVGFGTADSSGPSPLLRGLVLNRGSGETQWQGQMLRSHAVLMRQVFECTQTGKDEVELDLAALGDEETSPIRLADAFCVAGTLVAASEAALRAGDFEFYLQGGAGPSGVRMLGRFCHEDAEIETGVRYHLRQEEAHDPESIYAEVVYLPEGRIGNVLCRPVLRDYEIPYLGRSGAPPDRQLPVSDLLVGIEENNIVLYSARLGRRVVPRFTNAHGFMNPQLSSIYRFLGYLQVQHGATVPGFSWGPLETLDYLPRVRAGRLVLTLARWKISAKEVDALGKEQGSRRFLAVQELRRRRNLPRWVVLREADNSLPVDLENALSVDAFVHVLKRSSQAVLVELYPAPHQLCVSSPEGRFCHELQVPFVRKVRKQASEDEVPVTGKKRMAVAHAGASRDARILPPGSEWLYVKLYGGEAALDEILATSLPALARTVVTSGLVSRWFFLRYADPHHHLRIRFNVTPAQVSREVLLRIFATINPLLASGKLWKIDFDTYDREIERYGGTEGVLVAEDIFFADSEAVLEVLGELVGDEDMDVRWRVGLMGLDRLLTDWGLDDQAKLKAVELWRENFQREFKVDALGKKHLSDKFRAERSKLELMFEDSPDQNGKSQFVLQVLERRSIKVRAAHHRLQSLAAQGKLEADLIDLAASFSHMHVNRLMRSSQRAHELVLYDLLFHIYDGRVARKAQIDSVSSHPVLSEV